MTPGALYVAGAFTDTGGIADADRIATWNGSSWSAVSSSTSQIEIGSVSAIAVSGGKVYAGGTFTNAGDHPDADYLAAWDGTSWKPFCNATGPAFGGNVTSLQIIDQTLYVGGEFQNGAGIASADYLLACDLASGASSSTVVDPAHAFAGPVYALTADGDDTLLRGRRVQQPEEHPRRRQRRLQARRRHLAGHGRGRPAVRLCGHHLRPRSHRRRDRRVRRHGRERHRGHRAGRPRRAMERVGVERPGLRQRRRQRVAPDGGDPQARSAASFSLTQVIAYPTPTVTPDPSANPNPIPTPTATPSPTATPAAPDVTAPATSLRRAQINQAKRKATFKFASGEPGSTFTCKLDKKKLRPCASPKTYKTLERGKHVFRVKARDRAGNVDATPAVKRFKIK